MSKVRIRTPGGHEVMVEPERVLVENANLPHDKYGTADLWVIWPAGSTVPSAVVWAGSMSDALDAAADAELLGYFAVEEDDIERSESGPDRCISLGAELKSLGNYGIDYDLSDVVIDKLEVGQQPIETLLRFAEARGAGAETLED
jgi:hypothetical protein